VSEKGGGSESSPGTDRSSPPAGFLGTVPSESPGTVPGAFDELRALYDEFDRETEAIAPVCRASGRCCDFPAWGHTLFASRLEVDLLVSEAPRERFDPSSPLCPYWEDRRCAARAPRPLGCRAFFCDEAKAGAMQELHERFLRRLKDIHDRRGIPWRYAPLLRHLAEALPAR
jgi:Fe-S-cluster containining protein